MTAFNGRSVDARMCVARALQVWCNKLGIKALPAVGAKCDYSLRFDIEHLRDTVVGTTYGNVREPQRAGSPCLIVFTNCANVKWALRTPGGFLNTIARTFQTGNDLFTVASHEIGHALGLGHVEKAEDPLSAMHSAPESDGFNNGPSDRDVRMAANFLAA